MTPREKWQHLTHPQTPADYGLTLDADELATFPEGQTILAALRPGEASPDDLALMRQIGHNAAETIARIAVAALTNHPAEPMA